MKVSELIQELQKFNQDLEINFLGGIETGMSYDTGVEGVVSLKEDEGCLEFFTEYEENEDRDC